MILTIDCGLSAVKAAIASLDGKVVAFEREPYDSVLEADRAEQDPEDWWDALRAAVSRLSPALRRDVKLIVPTGHMHALVLVDGELNPVMPCLTLHDRRGGSQLESLSVSGIRALTGQVLDASLPLAKLMWLRNAHPELLSRTRVMLAPKDLIAAWLTGRLGTDPVDAAGSGLYDHRRARWAPELVEMSGLTLDQLPTVEPCQHVRGPLRPERAAELGIGPGAVVLAGAGDDIELLGATGYRAGVAVEHVGTTGAILAVTQPGAADSSRLPGVEEYPTAAPDIAAIGCSTPNCGSILRWATDVLGVDPLSVLDTAPRVDDPIVLPQLFAERAERPGGAAFAGITASHRQPDLARAVAVGVADTLRRCLAAAERASVPVQRIISSGGNTSVEWINLRAAAYGRPIETLVDDPTTLGCVALGLAAAGRFSSPTEAARNLSPQTRRVAVDPHLAGTLAALAERRAELEAALRPPEAITLVRHAGERVETESARLIHQS